MDIAKKLTLIIAIVVMIIIIVVGYFLYKLNVDNSKLKEENTNLGIENSALKVRITDDSITTELNKQSYGKQVVIKYIEKQIIHDSIVFFNSSVSNKERIFSEHTQDY